MEIERKFLVRDAGFLEGRTGERCIQGYLAFGPPVAVRVRIMGDQATLNIKTATVSIARHEYEYKIPLEDAEEILRTSCAGAIIEKTRYRVEYEGKTWDVDVFAGENAGLIVAEIELESEDEAFALPLWVGREVSGDPRYLNTSLCRNPYRRWSKEQP